MDNRASHIECSQRGQKISRSKLAWEAKWVALLLGLLIHGNAATQQNLLSTSGSSSVSADSVDLEDAHRDTRKFLLALAKLGRSAESDRQLLSKVTAQNIQLARDDKPRFRGVRETYHASLRLRGRDQLAGNTTYSYGITDVGEYKPAVRMNLNSDLACIRIEDLAATFGRPTRVIKYPPSPHLRKTGPLDVWEAVYVLNSRGEAWFSFSTKECAWQFALHPKGI